MNTLKRSSSAFFAVVLMLLIQTCVLGQKLPYLDLNQPIDKRVEDLLSRMTLEEKLGQLNSPIPGNMAKDLPGRMDACSKFAEGKFVTNIGPAGGFWAPAKLIKEGA